jgi:Glycosyl transferase family 11
MQIIVRQISGLGNQLFQYAAGRYYAKRHGADLRLLIDRPKRSHSYGFPRPFLLSHFSITTPMQPYTLKDRLLIGKRKPWPQISSPLRHSLGVLEFDEPLEQRYRFLEHLPLDQSVQTVYLFGYWQAHQLVNAVADELRTSLQFKDQAAGNNQEMLQQINECEHPVSLHIRRGDYTLAAEGNIALPLDYYSRAIAHFQERLTNPVFFVFSDDMAFAQNNMPAGIRAVFVDHNDDFSSHEDLRLMSACHHHIIANSSFSWWGAWLNPRADKMVVAPKFWLLKPESYFPGLLPPAWTLLEV